jgi:Lsr2
MAKKVTVSVVDDFDGTADADETVEFAIDGVSYEIDLSSKNAKSLRDDLGRWIAAARRVGGRRKVRSAARARTSGSSEESAAVREWARRSGYEVASRGRLPAEILAAYRAAG